jgi:hypothetical protein
LLRVAAGQIWASTARLNYLIDLISEVPSLRVLNSHGVRLLTAREEPVVALVAEGLGNRQIARQLDLSEHTIKSVASASLRNWESPRAWNSSPMRLITEILARPNGSPEIRGPCAPPKRKLSLDN